jgi:hypothetical protein
MHACDVKNAYKIVVARSEWNSGCPRHVLILPSVAGDGQFGPSTMKWWLLFVFDLAVVACAVRAGFLTYAANKADPRSEGIDRAWVISESNGWLAVGSVVAFAAFLVAIILK